MGEPERLSLLSDKLADAAGAKSVMERQSAAVEVAEVRKSWFTSAGIALHALVFGSKSGGLGRFAVKFCQVLLFWEPGRGLCCGCLASIPNRNEMRFARTRHLDFLSSWIHPIVVTYLVEPRTLID